MALSAALASEQGVSQDTTIQDAANLDLATAIINYLKANTVVSVNVAVDPGTHIGTGTGTIS